jgi:hypothetical protein
VLDVIFYLVFVNKKLKVKKLTLLILKNDDNINGIKILFESPKR